MGKRRAALLAALLLCGLAGLTLFPRPAPPPPTVLRPTRQRATQATHHLESLAQALTLAPMPASPSSAPPTRAALLKTPSGPRTLRVSEDDINVYLAGNGAARARLAARGVRAVQIELSPPNSVTLHADVTVSGQSKTALIVGTLAPDPTLGLRFTATSGQLGRLPLPPGVVTGQARTLLSGFLRRAPVCVSVQSAQVVGKTLVLVVLPQPGKRTPSPASR